MSEVLAGRLALVTGSSRGIGAAIATSLFEAGASVIGASRSTTPIRDDRRAGFACDLTDADAVSAFVDTVVKELGVPDIVINNAGAFLIKPIADTAAAEFRHQVEANATAPFLLMRSLTPHLRTKGGGHLVTIGSVADHQPFPGNAAYAAGKYALRGLHEVLALELKDAGVRATLIAPGATDTALWDKIDPDNRPGFLPRRDMLRSSDVADCVLFAVTRPARANVDLLYVTPTA